MPASHHPRPATTWQTALPRLATVLLLACLVACAWAQIGEPPTAPDEPPAPTDDASAAKALYEQAKAAEARGDLSSAALDYTRVISTYPDTEWADLAAARLDAIEMASFEAPGPGAMAFGWLLSMLSWVFWLLLITGAFGYWGYRRGWLWNWGPAVQVGDRIDRFITGFGVRKRLHREFEARKANPRDARARHNLGVVYYQSRRYQQALEELSESVAIDPDRIDAQYHLGLTLLKLGRPAEAIEPLAKVAEQKPAHGGDALVRLAEAKLQSGAPEEAEELLLKSVKRNPSDAESRYYLALAFDALGKPDEVPRLLQEAIQLGRAYRGTRRREALAAARNAKAYLRTR